MSTSGESSGPAPYLHEIERAIEAAGASVALKKLVESGCGRHDLLIHLSALRHCDSNLDDIEFWTGLDRRQAKRAAEHLEECASRIDSLNDRPFKAVLAGLTGWGRAPLLELPATIRTYAGELRGLLANVSGRQHRSQDFQIVALVNYVKKCTETWHDAEVAALRAAALGREEPSLEAHAQWRRENYDRLLGIVEKTRTLTDPADQSPKNAPDSDS